MNNLQTIKDYNLKQAEANQVNLNGMVRSLDTLLAIARQMNEISAKLEQSGLLKYKEVPTALRQVEGRIAALPKPVDISPQIDKLITAIKSQKLDPQITIPKLDLTPLQTTLEQINESINKQKAPKNIDTKGLQDTVAQVTEAVVQVEAAITGLKFPVPNYVLPFKDSNGRAAQLQMTSAGALPVDIQDASVTINGDVTVSSEVEVKNDSGNPIPMSATSLPLPSLAATSTKQSDGSQKSQLVDGSGTALDIIGEAYTSANTKIGLLLYGREAGSGASAVAHSLITDSSGRLLIGSVSGTSTTKETRASTPAQTSVSVTNSNTSVLASNANRLGATICNEGSAICYLKLGATATTSSYSVQIASGGYYEVPFNYTGAIDGITLASTAQLRITELTA